MRPSAAAPPERLDVSSIAGVRGGASSSRVSDSRAERMGRARPHFGQIAVLASAGTANPCAHVGQVIDRALMSRGRV